MNQTYSQRLTSSYKILIHVLKATQGLNTEVQANHY